jgi:hypothetical protein
LNEIKLRLTLVEITSIMENYGEELDHRRFFDIAKDGAMERTNEADDLGNAESDVHRPHPFHHMLVLQERRIVRSF